MVRFESGHTLNAATATQAPGWTLVLVISKELVQFLDAPVVPEERRGDERRPSHAPDRVAVG